MFIMQLTGEHYNEVVTKVLNNMMRKYPEMRSGDLQTAAIFSEMLKEELFR